MVKAKKPKLVSYKCPFCGSKEGIVQGANSHWGFHYCSKSRKVLIILDCGKKGGDSYLASFENALIMDEAI